MLLIYARMLSASHYFYYLSVNNYRLIAYKYIFYYYFYLALIGFLIVTNKKSIKTVLSSVVAEIQSLKQVLSSRHKLLALAICFGLALLLVFLLLRLAVVLFDVYSFEVYLLYVLGEWGYSATD